MSIKERTHDRVWSAYYGELGTEFMRDTQRRINWVCGQVDGRKVLDVGCSQGIVSILLAREGRSVVGVDSDSKSIAEANQYLSEETSIVQKRVTFINGDFLALDALQGELVDTVVMAEVLEHLVRPDDFVEAASQYLKPSGRIVVTVPFGINDFIDHKRTFYLAEPYLLLDRYFEITDIKVLGRWIGFVATKRAVPCLSGKDRTLPMSHVVGLEYAVHDIERGIRDEVATQRRKIVDLTAKQKANDEVVSRLTKDIEKQTVLASGLDKELEKMREEFRRRAGLLEKREAYLTEELSIRDATVRDLACQLLETHVILNTHKSSALKNELQFNQQFESERQLALKRESQLSAELCVAREQTEQTHSALEMLRVERTTEVENFFNREQVLKRELEQVTATLERRLAEMNQELEKLQRQSVQQQAEIAKSQEVSREQSEERATLERRLAEMNQELNVARVSEKAAAEHFSAFQRQLVDLKDDKQSLESQLALQHTQQTKLQRQLEVRSVRLVAQERRADKAVAQTEHIKNTLSFRLGNALIFAGKSWRNAATLPKTLWQIRSDAESRRQDKLAERVILVEATSVVHQPSAGIIQSKPGGLANEMKPQPAEVDFKKKLKSAPAIEKTDLVTKDDKPEPDKLFGAEQIPAFKKSLRVAAVMDDFTFQCFAPECDLHQITPQNWRYELEELKPELLFIESAWRGLNELWKNKITPASTEIMEVIEWCIDKNIPTVFWNKEDPFSFDRFLVVAKMVDYVFTTDINSIGAYRRELGHDRVYVLPFAAQPRLHNPIEVYERKDAVSFAGSYYWKYKHRMKDFDTVMSAVMRVKPVTIYDRNHERPRPHDFDFPENYRKYIVGSLPYSEIDKAYKGFLYAVNMSTSKNSPTMFARRVFELAASNTITISNYSHGIRLFFGDLVLCTDNENQFESQLRELAADPVKYRKIRLWSLRKVLSEHTYEHRLDFILSKINPLFVKGEKSKICLIGRYSNKEEFDTLCEIRQRQAYPVSLILIGTIQLKLDFSDGVVCVPVISKAQEFIDKHDYIAVVSAKDYYGENYINDLILATCFSDAEIVGKKAYYQRDGNIFNIVNDGAQYRPASCLSARSSLVKISKNRLAELIDADFDAYLWQGSDFLALDEFSYCRDARNLLTKAEKDCLDVSPVDNTGVDFDKVILSASIQKDPMPESWVLKPEDWGQYLPSKIPDGININIDRGAVHVKSMMAQDKFYYVYLKKDFSPSDVSFDKAARFQLEAEGRGDLKLVIVFNDANDKKISHIMVAANTRTRLNIPLDCVSIKMGIRLCGEFEMILKNIEFTNVVSSQNFLPCSRTLLCVSQYPSYDDLYRYAFVHSRVVAYKRSGFPVDVMRVSECQSPFSREFFGVEVVDGNIDSLSRALSLGHYDNLIIHSLTAKIWGVVKPYLGKIRMTVWSHGADIQPWFRRAARFPGDTERLNARRRAFEREGFWREVLDSDERMTRVVFVSKFSASEALCDLGVTPKAAVCVVPNPIDTELFKYQSKKPELRFNVLSIRPFANSIYANDLTVSAILLLAQRPGFEKLQFTIAGDGLLFDETVEPICHFENVRLIKRFLLQAEIAQLHAEHGIFLCPSRMDTHGVSRDEAMASGLVPVTSRVAAIPEFVDVSCGFMAEPEDANGLADAIERLVLDPERFMAMSKAASERVHRSTAAKHIIGHELAILGAVPVRSQVPEIMGVAGQYRIAIYGDVNLNIMDGSAVWAASLAETLAYVPGVTITLFLKAPIKRLHILESLINLNGRVRLVEPNISEDKALSVSSAIKVISEAHVAQPFDAIVLRGFDLCAGAIQQTWADLIWAYITDIPQTRETMTDEKHVKIDEIIRRSGRMLCQTHAFEDYVKKSFSSAEGKTLILPPMIPLISSAREKRADGPLRVVYAGKFAPLWGVREMFRSFSVLRQSVPDAELHVFGDKFHNPKDDLDFQDDIKRALKTQDGVYWHGAVGRNELLSKIRQMDVAWAYRDSELEANTHELSTKLLEYAATGIPVILARNHVNEELLGGDYPLFSNTETEASRILISIAKNPQLGDHAISILTNAAQCYTFVAVADLLMRQGIFERVNSSQWRIKDTKSKKKSVQFSEVVTV